MKRYLDLSLVVLSGFVVSCSGEGSYGPDGPGGWGGMMHYGFGLGGIFMVIIFLILIVVIFSIIRSRNRNGQRPTQNESPLDILKKRYAKGEITREEYEKMKRDLQ